MQPIYVKMEDGTAYRTCLADGSLWQPEMAELPHYQADNGQQPKSLAELPEKHQEEIAQAIQLGKELATPSKWNDMAARVQLQVHYSRLWDRLDIGWYADAAHPEKLGPFTSLWSRKEADFAGLSIPNLIAGCDGRIFPLRNPVQLNMADLGQFLDRMMRSKPIKPWEPNFYYNADSDSLEVMLVDSRSYDVWLGPDTTLTLSLDMETRKVTGLHLRGIRKLVGVADAAS